MGKNGSSIDFLQSLSKQFNFESYDYCTVLEILIGFQCGPPLLCLFFDWSEIFRFCTKNGVIQSKIDQRQSTYRSSSLLYLVLQFLRFQIIPEHFQDLDSSCLYRGMTVDFLFSGIFMKGEDDPISFADAHSQYFVMMSTCDFCLIKNRKNAPSRETFTFSDSKSGYRLTSKNLPHSQSCLVKCFA